MRQPDRSENISISRARARTWESHPDWKTAYDNATAKSRVISKAAIQSGAGVSAIARGEIMKLLPAIGTYAVQGVRQMSRRGA